MLYLIVAEAVILGVQIIFCFGYELMLQAFGLLQDLTELNFEY